jgi:hypothetical protein
LGVSPPPILLFFIYEKIKRCDEKCDKKSILQRYANKKYEKGKLHEYPV